MVPTVITHCISPAPEDYDAISAELTFSASTTRICRNVSSVEDTIPESDEDFILSLTTTDGDVILTPDEAIVTIMDNDDSKLLVFYSPYS